MKNIVLIGGSKGIGLATAKLLNEEYKVIVASRSKGDLEHINVTHLEFDVLKDDISTLDLPEIIDGLAFFPGSINLKPFKMLKTTDFETDLQLNFISLVKVVQGLLDKLKKSNQASLVFFSTIAAQTGMPFHTSVAASKSAIEGFAKSLAAELAPKIRVNVIAPSLTNTSLAEKLLNKEEKITKMAQRHPLKKIGEPEDIAKLTKFLLTEESSWITGQVIGIDGGLSTLNLQ